VSFDISVVIDLAQVWSSRWRKGEMMKRFGLVLFVLMIAFCGVGLVDSRAQQTVFVPVCTGTDDTAAFQTILKGAASNPRTIKIPYKSDLTKRCKVTTITFRGNITLDDTDGSGIARDAPNVVTVLGPVISPAGKKLFFGTGTTSLEANTFAGTNGQARLSKGASVDNWDNAADATVSRLTIKPVPTFDLAANTLGVGQIIPLSGTVVVPAGKTLSLIRLSQPLSANGDTMVAPDNGAVAMGLYSAFTADATSDANSNVYSVVAHVNNAGPGTTKGIHAEASASGSSTGVIVAGNFQIQPVANSHPGSAAIQLSLTSRGVNDIANGINIFSSGDRYRVGVGSVISAVPYSVAAFRAWMGTDSSSGARAFQVLNNAGNEIAYIHKDGVGSFPSLYVGARESSTLDSVSISDQLHLQGADSKLTALTIDTYATDPGLGTSIVGRRAQGTATSPTATQANDAVFLIGARGYQTTTNAFSASARAAISMHAAENFTSTAQGMFLSLQTTSIGSTTMVERLRITDSGNTSISTAGKGLILKSPDGNCWLTTVANGGALTTTSVACP
jgi:hypothetical protein